MLKILFNPGIILGIPDLEAFVTGTIMSNIIFSIRKF